MRLGFDADITVTRCGETVGATSIMGILTLGAGIGSTITVVAKGREAKEALTALQRWWLTGSARGSDPICDHCALRRAVLPRAGMTSLHQHIKTSLYL